jgi:hypothetical protein
VAREAPHAVDAKAQEGGLANLGQKNDCCREQQRQQHAHSSRSIQ